jgi:predicted methyltransferase
MPEVSYKKTQQITEKSGQIICGDNIEVIRKMPNDSIDAIVTDPP